MKARSVLPQRWSNLAWWLSLSALLFVSACQQPAADSNNHADAHGSHGAPQANATPRIPDHFASAEAAKPLPATLDPKQFSSPSIIKAYQLAKEIPDVLAQQPCYCYCDAGFGHKSLLDCQVDTHSAECLVCRKEVILTGQLHAAGKTATEIREAIIRGEWQKVEAD